MNRIVKSLSFAAGCLGMIPAAYADITYTQHMRVEAAGAMAMFSSEGDVVTRIAGDKSRGESNMKSQSGLLGSLVGSGQTANIVRLDKQLTWELQPDEQSYEEVTFAQLRQQMAQMNKSMPQNGSGVLPVSAESCQWDEGDLQVEHPGGTEQVAGISTNRHIVRLEQTCVDPQSGRTCELTWLMETWLAKNVPAEQEVRAFQRKYASALGMGDALSGVQGPGRGLVAMFSGNWDKLADEFARMEGYPLRTTMQMGIGGENCTTESGQPIAMDGVWADATTSAYNAALNQAGQEASSAVGRATAESLGQSVGGSIGGAAVGAAAGEIIGGLTSMFRKDKTEPAPEPAPAPAAAGGAGGKVTVFRISTEVTDWSEAAIPAASFEVPAGWKRR